MDAEDKSRLLSESELTEFEFHLWRVFYAFLRWQENCEKAVNDNALTGYELAMLHLIRMKDTPKSVGDIGQLLNRDDQFNLMYSIRKLLKRGLIKKLKQSGRTGHLYQVTPEGIKKTDDYTASKKSMLFPLFAQEYDLDMKELTKKLIKIKSLYDEAARTASTFNMEKILSDVELSDLSKKVKEEIL